MFVVQAPEVKLASCRRMVSGCGDLWDVTAFSGRVVSAIQRLVPAVGAPLQDGVGRGKPVVGRGTGAITTTAQIGDAMTDAPDPGPVAGIVL